MFKNTSISLRIWLLAGLAIIGFVANSAFISYEQYQTLILYRKQEITHTVDTAYSIINRAYELSNNGSLTVEKAQELAKAEITAMRYGNGNYFWINDMQPVVLAHGAAQRLVGKSAANIADRQGRHLYLEFVEVARKQGSGYVEYAWPKPGETEETSKIAYVQLFPEWGWIVGTGAYIDDIEDEFSDILKYQLMILIAIASLFVAASYVIANSIVRPMRNTINAMTDVAEGDGDLTVRLSTDSNDELSELARGFNAFAEKVRTIIVKMQNNGESLDKEADQTSMIASQSENILAQHQQETHQVATAMHQMSATLAEMATNANDAAQSVSAVQSLAMDGKSVVQENIAQINEVADLVDKAVGAIEKLNHDTESIGGILDVIKGIADQTNLLALNAAIEAARAGEQGRGFAVVADEVRTLAMRTQESTHEIEQKIGNLQTGAGLARNAVLQSKEKTQTSVQQAHNAGSSFEEISHDIDSIADMNTQIASATEEQSAVVATINENVENINTASSQSADGARELATSSKKLKKLSDDINSLLAQFKV